MRVLPMEGAMEGLMPRVASACTTPPMAPVTCCIWSNHMQQGDMQPGAGAVPGLIACAAGMLFADWRN